MSYSGVSLSTGGSLALVQGFSSEVLLAGKMHGQALRDDGEKARARHVPTGRIPATCRRRCQPASCHRRRGAS